MISEVNYMQSNSNEWWIDMSATRHMCNVPEIRPKKYIFNIIKTVIQTCSYKPKYQSMSIHHIISD